MKFLTKSLKVDIQAMRYSLLHPNKKSKNPEQSMRDRINFWKNYFSSIKCETQTQRQIVKDALEFINRVNNSYEL